MNRPGSIAPHAFDRKAQGGRRAVVALLLAGALPALAQGTPARYAIDPNHLSIGFLVDHLGYAKVLGAFRTARGGFSFDETRGVMTDLRVEVDTASISTHSNNRDEHLRGADFLNVAEHPRMVFTAAGARRTGERTFQVDGQLQLLGRTQPLSLQATWNKSGESPIGGGLLGRKPYVMGVSARGSFKRSAFGMNYGVANGWVGDEVAVIIEFEAVRQ